MREDCSDKRLYLKDYIKYSYHNAGSGFYATHGQLVQSFELMISAVFWVNDKWVTCKQI